MPKNPHEKILVNNKTFFHIALSPKKTRIEYLGSMIKLGGNPKTYDRAASMIPFSKKMKCMLELVTFEIKVGRQISIMISNFS
jgi:hypothetical protein